MRLKFILLSFFGFLLGSKKVLAQADFGQNNIHCDCGPTLTPPEMLGEYIRYVFRNIDIYLIAFIVLIIILIIFIIFVIKKRKKIRKM